MGILGHLALARGIQFYGRFDYENSYKPVLACMNHGSNQIEVRGSNPSICIAYVYL